MKQLLNSSPAAYGTAGGAFTGFIINVGRGDLQRTIILAAVGTLVSFTLSLVLKAMVSKWRKHR